MIRALRPLIYKDKVFAASRAGLVMAFDKESGDRLWTFDVRDDGTGSFLDGPEILECEKQPGFPVVLVRGYDKSFCRH